MTRAHLHKICLSRTQEKNNRHDELINQKSKNWTTTETVFGQFLLGNCLERNVNVEPLLIH